MKGMRFCQITFGAFVSIFIACTDPKIAPNQVQGYWELKSATREGQITSTLEGTWIELAPDNMRFTSNLPLGMSGNENYKLVGEKIEINTDPILVLERTESKPGELNLAFQTRGISFTMQFVKATKPIE
jgi:hypothetical protein